MRAARFLLFVASALALGLAGCSHACPSASAALPATEVRFVASASAGSVAQIVLLTTTPALDATGNPRHDAMGNAILTVARIRDYAGGTTAESWLDDRSRWPGMRGRGIGNTPFLPPATGGPFVAVGGASSVVRFTLAPEDTTDAGSPAVDAGLVSAPHSHRWEWPWPTPTSAEAMADANQPGLADLVVVPHYPPFHDLALVSRTTVVNAGQPSGGELFVLDIDDPAHVISLATISFDMYADAGLRAMASSLAYSDGLVYVALDHQDFGSIPRYGPGLVAVVDPEMRSVRTVLRLPQQTNCVQLAAYHPPTRTATDPADPGENHRLVVGCAGTAPATQGAPPTDGGFAYVEYDPASADRLPTLARTITAVSLGLPRADGGIAPLFGHWVAYVSRGTASPVFADRVIAANLDTGASQILASAPARNGISLVGLGQGAFDAGSGVLVVPNGFDGVLTWQVPHDRATLEAPAGYAFADPTTAAVVGCGHLATRIVRAVGAAPVVTSMQDAAMPMTDAGTNVDAATPADDAGVDAAAPAVDAAHVDSGRDAAADV